MQKKNSVTFYPEDSYTPKKRITPKNLGWILANMRYIESVAITAGETGSHEATLEVKGNRHGEVFEGFFTFADLSVCREWCEKRRHFQYVGVDDQLKGF